VVDGDTLGVSGPFGEVRVRLIGVNAPESGECFSEESTDALAELVATSDLDGVEIVIDVNADAPGDDGVDLNGAWVSFTNAGAEMVDLDGCEVADESASHRYTFDDFRLGPGAEVTLSSGCGRDDDATRHWCVSGSAVWNNSGDTVFLRDRNGNTVSLSDGDAG
jgi:hypothetical protein